MSPLQHCLIISILLVTFMVTKVTNFLHFNTNMSFFRGIAGRIRYVQRLHKIRSHGLFHGVEQNFPTHGR